MKNQGNDALGEYTGPREVRIVRLLPGPIERVWSYLTDGEKRAKWLASGPMDLRTGGRVEMKFRHIDLAPTETPPPEYKAMHEQGVTMIGKVTRCEPPRILAFTWWTEDVGGSEVTFELSPHGEQVQLVLTHRRLGADRNELMSVGAGWHTHVAILIAHLAGEVPPPFWATHARLKSEYAKRIPSGTTE